MEPQMTASQLIIKPHQKVPTKVLLGSSKNYKPSDNYKSPLMVNAWSQTTRDDFAYLNEIENKEQQSQREKELEEKIKVLEENLRAHSELLSQIHATSARTTAFLGQQQQQQQQLPQYPKPIHNSSIETQAIQFKGQTHNKTPQISPKLVNNTTAHYSSPNSVINPMQQVGSNSSDSIKYTIIAEGTGDHNDEPIEIQLAEDDGALNLNSSADSGRLEICLAPEENVEIKTEFNSNHSIPASTTSEHHFIKRRKLAVDQHEVLPTNSNYFFNAQGVLTPSSGSTNYSSMSQPTITKPQKRRSSNSLLKTPKIENTSSTHIQTTSIHSLMPSPNNSISSHSVGGSSSHIGPDNIMVSIGPNNTRIPAKIYENMSWTSASIATRKLLMAIFDRQTLATHSMTGKPSPAFKDHGKPLKEMLDPLVIADIIFAVTRKCNVSDKEVRNAITTKCADENKMMKLQMNKRTPMRELNKENMVG